MVIAILTKASLKKSAKVLAKLRVNQKILFEKKVILQKCAKNKSVEEETTCEFVYDGMI